jgi:hypothetical protein
VPRNPKPGKYSKDKATLSHDEVIGYLEKFRQEKNYSRNQLAREAQVTPSAVHNWYEKGVYPSRAFDRLKEIGALPQDAPSPTVTEDDRVEWEMQRRHRSSSVYEKEMARTAREIRALARDVRHWLRGEDLDPID